jgi:hypothetical protein
MDGFLFMEAIETPYVPASNYEHLLIGKWLEMGLMAPGLLFFPTPLLFPYCFWGRGWGMGNS